MSGNDLGHDRESNDRRFRDFAPLLLRWWDSSGRKDLPWQTAPSPYRVWVSEIMLQQTQVTTVMPFYERFMRRFPNLATLAGAPLDEVLGLWSGLGYYARARNLHRTAAEIQNRFGGRFPTDRQVLMSLPGIGRSTAAAILALSTDQAHAILDGNVKRVLARLHAVRGYPGHSATLAQLWDLSERHTPAARAAHYTQAIMDLGATVCSRRNPACLRCPVLSVCAAYAQDLVGQLPASRPRKALPVRDTRFLVVREPGGGLLLQRREDTGIWGGLWCFPQCEPDADWQAWLASTLGLEAEHTRPLATLKHSFTHFRLAIHPLLIMLNGPAIHIGIADLDRYRFVHPAHLAGGEIGVPKPVHAIFAALACGSQQCP